MDPETEELWHGDVRIWFRLTEGIREREVAELIAGLPASERERCLRLRFPHDRRDFAAAHALLRATLSRYGSIADAEWEFETNEYGKPAISQAHNTDLTFNLSHTHGLVACAVTRGAAIGIDVESVSRMANARDIVGYYFSPAEINALEGVMAEEYARRFTEVWTLKEAYIKAVGVGLSCALDSFSFVNARDGQIDFTPPAKEKDGKWQFYLCEPAAGYCLALAVECMAHSAEWTVALHEAGAEGTTSPSTRH